MTGANGFDRLGFSAAFEAEVDPEFPADGDWRRPVYAFDRDGDLQDEFVSRWGPPRIVRVQPAHSPEWIGMFAAGGLGVESGVFATPAPERLCVVVDGLAYLVNVDSPADGAVIAHNQVHQVVASAETSLLLLVRFIDIVALGADGVAWQSPRLAVDDLRVVEVSAAGIHCTGDLLAGDPDSFVVDPESGLVISGPRLEGPPWNPPTRTGRGSWWRRSA
ncbi:hypothetical protein [Cellulomonas rhizosphaerae]|uniref:Uncharacterized protein n=1 Tax=Cellulomonas rhizosphaerae TaxID=2293719 RepID=A0A413RHQ7_9CELL|nr:hypothetical protein [Cellulomonas rhizosphaerae]RHA37746.1 hypothetical protein D1825_16015 [Cellulomonas rhizosphaerae]